MSLQCSLVYASAGANELQDFLAYYVRKAGQLVVAFGIFELCMSLVTKETRVKSLKYIGSGLILLSVNDIINTILK